MKTMHVVYVSKHNAGALWSSDYLHAQTAMKGTQFNYTADIEPGHDMETAIVDVACTAVGKAFPVGGCLTGRLADEHPRRGAWYVIVTFDRAD